MAICYHSHIDIEEKGPALRVSCIDCFRAVYVPRVEHGVVLRSPGGWDMSFGALDRLRKLLLLPRELWWLSFADATRVKGEQFLGAALVRGRGFADAVGRSHELGINPGGECQGQGPIDLETPDEWIERLLTREECAELDELWLQQRSDDDE